MKANYLPALAERYPGIVYDFEGQEKRTSESLDSIKSGYLLAMMGIFLLLASQFRSYIQPVIIMMAIPFGLIGAILGHLIMGMEFTIVSVFGIVALSGIVVNDSLILIDFINRALRDGVDLHQAVIESGKSRFRPVLLTSVTTIAGLFPLLLERSFQAQFLIPMAVSLCFGLLVATILTLLYVPALYLIVIDVSNAFTSREQRQLNVASGPEGPQGPTPRREGGLRPAGVKGACAPEGMRPPPPKGLRPGEKAQVADGRNQLPAVGREQRADAGIQRTEVGGRRTEVTGQKTVPKSLKTAAVKRVVATGRPMAGDKSRKIDVREQRAKTIGPQRSRPSTSLNPAPQERKRKAEVKEPKRKVRI